MIRERYFWRDDRDKMQSNSSEKYIRFVSKKNGAEPPQLAKG